MGIFDERKSLSRKELRKKFRRDEGRIPETGGKKYTRREREELGGSFDRKYGSQISKRDYRSAIRDLKRQKRDAETPEEEREIEDRINYLEEQM